MLPGPTPGIRASRLPASEPARGTDVVLVDLEAHASKLSRNPVRAGPLVTRRALDPAQRGERLVQPLALGVGGAPHRVAAGAVAPSPFCPDPFPPCATPLTPRATASV